MKAQCIVQKEVCKQKVGPFALPVSYPQLPKSINVSLLQLLSPVVETVVSRKTEVAVDTKCSVSSAVFTTVSQ